MLYWQFPGGHKTDCALCGTSFYLTEYGEIYCPKGCPDEAIEKLDETIETADEVLKSSETDKVISSFKIPKDDAIIGNHEILEHHRIIAENTVRKVVTTECGNILKVVDLDKILESNTSASSKCPTADTIKYADVIASEITGTIETIDKDVLSE